MKINIEVDLFKEKWHLADRGEDVYTDGKLKGIIFYEDDSYIVIELKE